MPVCYMTYLNVSWLGLIKVAILGYQLLYILMSALFVLETGNKN